VYNRTVTNTVINNVTINNTTINRASYNGPGGVTRQSVPAEIAAMHEQRIPPMSTQLQQQQAAAQNRQQFASANHGRPAVLAATKPIPVGKPIAPVIPARPAAATRAAAPVAQPNRPQPAPARPAAPAPANPAEKPAESMRKTVQPAQPAAKLAAPRSTISTGCASATSETRNAATRSAQAGPEAGSQTGHPASGQEATAKRKAEAGVKHLRGDSHPVRRSKTPPWHTAATYNGIGCVARAISPAKTTED
jgi:hypothetical protein